MMTPDSRPGKNPSRTTRRAFLGGTALAAATVTVLPRHVLAGGDTPPPSEKLNIAGVGVGGMGGSNLANCKDENIVALCDVDAEGYAANTIAQYPKAVVYKDFRRMLDKQKDIDAVIVATPDHSHAVIGMAAIQRGKHVYIQKPFAHSVYEARLLTEAARKHKVATQLGNQGHSGDGVRMICEWIWDGAIGPVREVHAWTNRPVWPQGIEVDRPKETPPVARLARLGPVDRTGRHAPVSPDLSSGQLAGVVGFRHRVAGRLGLPYPRRAVLGLETEVSHAAWKAAFRPTGTTCGSLARPRTRITRDRRSCGSSFRPGRHARGEADLVGRGHAAAAAGRAEPGRRMGDERRRSAVHRRQGFADVRLLRPQPAVDPGRQDAGLQAAQGDDRADPRRRTGTREGLGPRLQGRPAGQFELRLLRPSVGNGAHGEPGRPLSPAASCSGTARRWKSPTTARQMPTSAAIIAKGGRYRIGRDGD